MQLKAFFFLIDLYSMEKALMWVMYCASEPEAYAASWQETSIQYFVHI